MSERTYTERELTFARRDAFVAGAFAAHADRLGCENAKADAGMYQWKPLAGRPFIDGDQAHAAAASKYPLPMVTRPRAVPDPEGIGEWAAVDGSLRWRAQPHHRWEKWIDFKNSAACAPIAPRVAVWADVLANPTETVPDDA